MQRPRRCAGRRCGRQQHHGHPDARLGVGAAEHQVLDVAVQRRAAERAGLAESVTGRERRPGRQSGVPPVLRRDQTFDLDGVGEAGHPAGLHRGQHGVAVPRAGLGPVDGRAGHRVRTREECVVRLPPVRRQLGIARRRIADQERRVTHQLAAPDDLVECLLPGRTELDRVVPQVVVPCGAADVQQDAGRCVGQPLHRRRGERGVEQGAVDHRQVGVGHHHVGRDPLAVGGDHRGSPAAAALRCGRPRCRSGTSPRRRSPRRPAREAARAFRPRGSRRPRRSPCRR